MTQSTTEQTDPGIWDNKVLDQFEIPFGDWIDQSVDWIDVELDWLLQAIEWPFAQLLSLLVDQVLEKVSWVLVCLAFFILGSLIRNVKVGAGSAIALATCGILGNAYWLETSRTIGYIFVAVLLSVLIGVPVGVMCGRIDPVWKVVRPILDAMQVVHSFVYMLPFIFFFGIGPTSATMVTMVFALPPLIRLTNLGIRQVPEDVVEASRAYGAPEWRVLLDVQLPLARPAIMTGLNQTLLLAISMLGIAALMGAGGLGRLLFRALSNQDVSLASSGGLAFFLVAVVLDRMTQPEDGDSGNLFHRLRLAWNHRSDPEVLIPIPEQRVAPVSAPPSGPTLAPVSSTERPWMALTGFGGLLGLISVFLPWTSEASKIGSYGRRVDEELLGLTFNGLSASGGSFFGYLVFAASIFVLVSTALTMRSPGVGPRWLTTDGAAIAGFVMLLPTLAYVLASSPNPVQATTEVGVWVALVGGLLAAGGSAMWVLNAPHTPLHPLSSAVSVGRIIGVGIAVVTLGIASISGWSFDEREDVVFSDELLQEIDGLKQKAVDEPENAGAIAAELSSLVASATNRGTIITSGTSGDGPRLGLWTLLFGIAGLGTSLGAAGLFGRDEHREWVWSTLTAGIGAGTAAIAVAWIGTLARSADPNYVSGVGAFLAFLGGMFILASAGPVLKEFRRERIYGDIPHAEAVLEASEPRVESLV